MRKSGVKLKERKVEIKGSLLRGDVSEIARQVNCSTNYVNAVLSGKANQVSRKAKMIINTGKSIADNNYYNNFK